MRNLTHLLVTTLIVVGAASPAQADRFALQSGGVVEGTLVNRQQTPRTTYEIQTTAGAKIVLDAAAVTEVTKQKEDEEEYCRVAPGYEDTVDGQWKLAEWCRQKNLKPQRETHLRRVVELEPNHVQARHALGFVQLQGEWTTRSDNLTSKGYQLYRGQWRTPQDIALIEQREKAKLVAKEWLGRLKRWRVELNDPKLAAAAYQRITAIKEESAVGPLCEMLRSEASRDVKAMYVEVLGQVGNGPAIEAIVYLSLNDPDVEIFHACADTLARIDPPNLHEPYLKALKDPNNVRLNRAAHMLGRIGEKSSIGPMIEVLVTTHRVVTTTGGGAKGDAISTSFSNDGSNSFQNGAATQTTDHVAQNYEVLTALTRLSGQSFGFDQTAWRRWHATERSRAPKVELKK